MNPDLPFAYIAFSLAPTSLTPGRLRLRVPEKRLQEDYFDQVRSKIIKIEGVLSVNVKHTTAAILIESESLPEDLALEIQKLRLFNLVKKETIPPEKLEASYLKFTDKEKATMKLLGYVGFATLQALRGQVLGPGSSLFGESRSYWNEVKRLSEED